jgi:ABC-type transport system involved in cytochrome bd biosynthesis fused ATPase/permease subunit
VLLATGPVLVRAGLIGRRPGDRRSGRRRALDRVLRGHAAGNATLRAFGRSREQADRIREIGLRFGDWTMTVLRTAFQASPCSNLAPRRWRWWP